MMQLHYIYELSTIIRAKQGGNFYIIVDESRINFCIAYHKGKYIIGATTQDWFRPDFPRHPNRSLYFSTHITTTKKATIENLAIILIQKLNFKDKTWQGVSNLSISEYSFLWSLSNIWESLSISLIGDALQSAAERVVESLQIIPKYYNIGITVTKEYIQRYGSELRYNIGSLLETIMLRYNLAAAFLWGEKAQFAPLDLLVLAKALPSHRTWKETGWVKGVDKKWRFEITDKQLKLKVGTPMYEINKLSDMLEAPELAKNYPEILDTPVRFVHDFEDESISARVVVTAGIEVIEIKRNFLQDYQPTIEEVERVKEKHNIPWQLFHNHFIVNTHLWNSKCFKETYHSITPEVQKKIDDLTTRYEEFNEKNPLPIPTEEQKERSLLFGAPLERIPFWFREGSEQYSAQEALEIQVFEAWQEGKLVKDPKGNVALFNDVKGDIKDTYTLRNQIGAIDYGKGKIIKNNKLLNSSTGEPLTWKRISNVQSLLSILLHEIQHCIQHIEGFTPGWSSNYFANEITWIGKILQVDLSKGALEKGKDVYHRLGGEVEARNIEKRNKLTEEERKEKNPRTTEDVKRKDQLLWRKIDRAISDSIEEIQNLEIE